MDFHSMKRKELQALCKKHKIPANLSNPEMAKRLKEYFKEKENSSIQGLIKGQDENASEAESTNMVMDFHSMKHRELQALCRKHKIPANLSNLEMAKRLTEFFKENEKSSIQGLICGQDDNASETESTNMVMNRKFKKVRFSPEHELIEFTRSPEIKRRSRRNAVSIRTSSSSVENVDSGRMNSENVDGQGRVTLFRGSKLMEGQVDEKKRGRKGVKRYEQKNNVPTVENTDNGGLRDGGVDGTSRVLRSREKKLADDVKNVRKRGKAKKYEKRDKNALDDVDEEKSIEEIVTKTKRMRRLVQIADNVPLLRAETDDNGVVTRRSSRNRGVLEQNKIAEVHRMIESQILLSRSKRNANAVGDSQILSDDTRNYENGGAEGSRKSAKSLAADGSGVDAESGISRGETDGRVLRIEEPIKLEVRRSNRRKDVITLHEEGRIGELKAEKENTYMLSSVPQLVIGGGVSKNGKKVPQPQPIMRRSRRKTTILEPIASDEKFDTDAAVENCETEKLSSTRRSRRVASAYKSLEIIDELGRDFIIHQKNEARKRKRGPISEGDVVTTNDPSSLKQSMEESRNDKAVSSVEAQLSKSEGAESTSNPGLSSDTRSKNITSDVGLESSTKIHREEQDVSIADSADTDFIDRNELADSKENEVIRIAELETDSAGSEKQISASNIQDAGKVDSMEFDVQDIIEQDITKMDKNQFEAQLFSQIKVSSRVNTIDKQILQEGSNVSGNEGFAETSSSADSVLLADLEVTEAEANTHTQPGSVMVDHVGEVEAISVQENLNSVEAGEDNVISSSIACHHNDVDHMEASNSISDYSKEDKASKTGEVSAPESCDRCIDSTDSKSALQLKVISSGKLRSIKCDNAGEGDETYFQKGIVSELAETEKGGCLKDQTIASNQDDEFGVPDLFGGERSVRIAPQDRGVISGEYSAMKSDKQPMDKESLAVSPITTSPNVTNICLERDLEAEDTGQGEKNCIDKSINSDAKTDEGGSPNCCKSKCDEDREFVMSNILDGERRNKTMLEDIEILSGENSVKDFDEKGMESKLRSGHESDLRAERDEGSVRKDNQSESAENNEGGCLKNHKNTKDGGWEFSVSNLFDGEKSDRMTPQDRRIFSAEDSIKDFDEQVVFDDFLALSTMCNEVKISAGSSSLKEISPKPNSSPQAQGTRSIISDACEIIDNEAGGATIPEKEVAIVQNNIPGDAMLDKRINDGDHEILKQADEHTNEYTPKQAEQSKSPSAMPTAIANTIQCQEAWSGASETTGHAMCMSQTKGKGITSPVVDGSNTDEDGNDANFAQDKDEFADACNTEDTEYQSKNLHEKHTASDVGEKPNAVGSSQSWTEIELSNLFEATMLDVTPTGLNDATSQGTEKEMEGERGSESAKTTYENAFLPTNKKVSDSDPGSGVDKEDNQLKLLVATPIKIDSPSKDDETSRHEKKLDRADVSITECVGTTNENAAVQTKSDEKVRDAENELENSLCLGSSSDNGEEINYEELNEVESVELVNTPTIFLSEASEEHLTENTCDECLKKSDFTTDDNREEQIISLGESCLYEEARDKISELTEKNTISSSGSLKNLDKLEGCQDLSIDTDLSENLSCGNRACLKSERKVAQCYGAEFELSDAVIQKSNVLENSHHLTVCYEDNNLSETSIDDTVKGLMDAEVANIGCFTGEKGVINKGNSPSLFSKASNDDDEVTERKGETGDDNDPYEVKMWDEKDDNSRSFHDISDEPHHNAEVAILKSPSVGNTLELQSTCKEAITITQNVDNVLPAAEQGLPVSGAEFNVFSILAMNLLPGDNENGDSEKSEAGTPVYNSEGDHEKNSKEVEENSTATKAPFSISELHLEQKVSVSDEVSDNENGDIEKSDVGAPLLNLEGDHEKNDKQVKGNSTATIVQFPILELHLEEKSIDSNNDVPAAFGCNEFLNESDVDDTIKEYIDSELARMNEMTACEDGLLSVESLGMESKQPEEATCVDLHVGGYTAEKSSVVTKGEEQIEKMFKESVTGPDPVCVDLVGNSGSARNDALLLQKEKIESKEDGHISSSRQLCSAAEKNARTILIHGTPSKVMTMANMKENAPTQKSANIGDFTAVRPAKRKALQDVQWK